MNLEKGEEPIEFIDVSDKHWAKKEIEITRAQMATLMDRIESHIE